MKLDVYNTYARHSDGTLMHFDVLTPSGSGIELAREQAMAWLDCIGVAANQLALESCDFCHVENATQEYATQVERRGYAILQLEGCPPSVY